MQCTRLVTNVENAQHAGEAEPHIDKVHENSTY
jgi:hypothetical protein